MTSGIVTNSAGEPEIEPELYDKIYDVLQEGFDLIDDEALAKPPDVLNGARAMLPQPADQWGIIQANVAAMGECYSLAATRTQPSCGSSWS